MQKQLTIEKRGEHFHLRFHNYHGPWEGHQIESALSLEEVEPPPDGESYQGVLGLNQCYLWHEMTKEPDLHALIGADRLEALARLVHDRHVEVIEGAEHLPEPPASTASSEPVQETSGEEESYVAYIEHRHESTWEKGPKAVIVAVLWRAIPALVIIAALVLLSRHMGDHYESVSLDALFARANRQPVQQNFFSRLISPDFSEFVRHEIRKVNYAQANRMILGDGSYIAFDGIKDVMPLLTQAQNMRAAIVVDAHVDTGKLLVDRITCGGEVMAENVRIRRIMKLAPSETPPARGSGDQPGIFRPVEQIPYDLHADTVLDTWVGKRISAKGAIVQEGDQRIFRAESGAGIVIHAPRVSPSLRQFLDVFVGDPGPITLDMVFTRKYPFEGRRGSPVARKSSRLVGEADVYSASAQKYTVVGRH